MLAGENEEMSLAIEEDDVTAVLLADGWHTVADNSFYTDAYEYADGDRITVGGGSVPGVPSTGFLFRDESGEYLSGPLSSILAVKQST